MLRWLRRNLHWVAVAGIVAALVMALGLYLIQFAPILLSREAGKKLIAEWADQNLDLELKAGWIAPVTVPGPGIQIKDLELRFKTERAGTSEFFGAESIKVMADFRELMLKKALVWTGVVIEKPRLTLVRGKDKKWNVAAWAQDLPLKKKTSEEPAPDEPDSFFMWMVRDSVARALPASKEEWLELLALERFEIRDARIKARDRYPGKKLLLGPLELDHVNLTVRGRTVKDLVEFNLSFPFQRPPRKKTGSEFKLQGAFRIGEDLDHPSFTLTSLSGGWQGLRLHRVSGEVKFKPKMRFNVDVNLSFDYPSFFRAVTYPPIAHSKTLPFTSGEGAAQVKVRLWGPDLSRRFKIHYQGEVTIKNMTWDPGRVIAEIHGLSGTARLNDGVVELPAMTVTIGGSVIHGSGRILERQHPFFDLDLKSERVDFAKFFVGRKLKERYGSRILPMKTEWGGRVDLGEGAYKKMKMLNARGQWFIGHDRVLTFPELSFDACGGSYVESGRSFVNFNDLEVYDFRFDGRIRGIDITQFVDQLWNTTVFLHGKTRADGYVAGKFRNGKFSTPDLEGKLALTITDGFFEGYNPAGAALKAFGQPAPAELQGLRFKRMSADVTMKNGVGYTENLVVEAPGLKGEVKGWINFATQHCDLKVKLTLFGELAGLVRLFPVVGEPAAQAGADLSSIYVRVSGHWDSLKYAVDNPLDSSMPEPPG